MSNSYVMKVSSTGQVSIPAETRARWRTERVVVVDLGDRIVLRPMPTDPVAALVGKYRGRGLSTESTRDEARAADMEFENRRA